jgi:DNA polymerase (family 10)
MNNKEIAKILEEIGQMLELKGENPFKSRAYFNAARMIETYSRPLQELGGKEEIGKIKGIGTALADKISRLLDNGDLPYYNDLRASLPEGLMDLLKIPGLGAKKVRVIYDKLKISSVGELEYACTENRLRDLPGFGEKSQAKIFASIQLFKKYSERYLYPVALDAAEDLLAYLKKHDSITDIEIAGSLRRRKETIGDIDIVAACGTAERSAVMAYLIQYPGTAAIEAHGDTKSTIALKIGIKADLRLVSRNSFPFLLHHATGSKEHNIAMRSRAQNRDLKLNEYGLFSGDTEIPCKTESEIYRQLELAYIPPELRENYGEIESAESGELPDLFTGEPFFGHFHVHSTWSDGSNSIEEIARYCISQGLQYVGITDHSKSAFYANGLKEDRIHAQHEEIDKLNESLHPFHIFKGIEVDILANGDLDYTDNILSLFDFVIASVHSQFTLSRDAMTTRICKAVKHPAVTMLGHPTGRLLLAREAYQLDIQKVIETAAEYGKIIEINANPYRLDLDWHDGRYAKKLGVRTSINPDAHALEGFSDYLYGIGIARKAWFTAEDILNTFDLPSVTTYLKK